MKNVLFLASLLSIASISCKHSDVDPPVESPPPVEGTYQARYYDSRSTPRDPFLYPINGQKLTLQIKHVSTDTVSVEIIPSSSTSSLPDGIYSPTQTLFYPKAYIESPNTKTSYIYLAGKQGSQISATNPMIWIYRATKSADYFFAPQKTPNSPHSVRFEMN